MSDTAEATRKKIGRPGKSEEGPRVAQSTRVRPSVAEKLAREAERNGRSIGEEIEHRLTQSFDSVYLPPISQEARSRLLQDASQDGASISETLKAWVESHVQQRDYLDDDRTRVLTRMVENACFTVEKAGGMRWDESPLVAAAVLATIIRSLGSLMPPGSFDEREKALVSAISNVAVRDEHARAVAFVDPGIDSLTTEILGAWQQEVACRREAQIAARRAELDAEYPDLAAMSDEEREAKRQRDLETLRSLVPRYRNMTEDEIEADIRASSDT